ncbi:MAG: hypothetical protein ACHBN1_13680 [Heteroscytonema crispum UTEX LB 1556]
MGGRLGGQARRVWGQGEIPTNQCPSDGRCKGCRETMHGSRSWSATALPHQRTASPMPNVKKY